MADITRRTLLHRALLAAALGGGALLGVTRPVKHKLATAPPAPPAALTAALARQRQLLAAYDRALTLQRAHPGLAGLRADLAAHGTALREVLQRYPGWRLSVTASVPRTGITPGSTGSPPGSTTPGTTPSGSSKADPIAALAAASTSAANATSAACLAWPATEAHAAEVVPLLGSIAACLSSHAEVLG
jgi:hypothetical protein